MASKGSIQGKLSEQVGKLSDAERRRTSSNKDEQLTARTEISQARSRIGSLQGDLNTAIAEDANKEAAKSIEAANKKNAAVKKAEAKAKEAKAVESSKASKVESAKKTSKKDIIAKGIEKKDAKKFKRDDAGSIKSSFLDSYEVTKEESSETAKKGITDKGSAKK